MHLLRVRSIFLALMLTFTFVPTPSQAETILDEKVLQMRYPWALNGGEVTYRYKFDSTPKPGKETSISFNFSAEVPDIKSHLSRIKTGGLVYNSNGGAWAFNLSEVAVLSVYATFDISLRCMTSQGGLSKTNRFSIHRLISPYTSYELNPSASSIFDYNIDRRGLTEEGQIFDAQNTIKYLVPQNCQTLNLLPSYGQIWIGYAGPWVYSFEGKLYKPESPWIRVSIHKTQLNDTETPLVTFAAPKTTATAKASPSPKVTSKSTPRATTTAKATTTVKEGASCTPAGKIASASGSSFVCAKVAGKNIWVQLAGKTQAPTPTPVENKCQTGIGSSIPAKLFATGLEPAVLEVTNPFPCNISFSIRGQLTCSYYPQQKRLLSASATNFLGPKETRRFRPSQIFPSEGALCDQLQRGAPAEYGAGILWWHSNSYVANVLSISP